MHIFGGSFSNMYFFGLLVWIEVDVMELKWDTVRLWFFFSFLGRV